MMYSDHRQELGTGVQLVDKGVAGEILAQGNVFQRHLLPLLFLQSRQEGALACSTVYTAGSTSAPMARSRENTRFMVGTARPIASNASPWENTSRGVPT